MLRTFADRTVLHTHNDKVNIIFSVVWPKLSVSYTVKFNIYLIKCYEGREHMYSYTLFLTSVLDGGGWSTPRPGRFTAKKQTWCPLYRRLGGLQILPGRVRKISPPPPLWFEPQNVQPVANRHILKCMSKIQSLSEFLITLWRNCTSVLRDMNEAINRCYWHAAGLEER